MDSQKAENPDTISGISILCRIIRQELPPHKIKLFFAF